MNEWAAAPSTGFVLRESNLVVSTGNFFLRRSLYQELGPFRDYVIAHDLHFLLQAVLVTESLLVKEKLYFYRGHGANTFYSQIGRTEEELARIYADYLRAAAARPPRNPLAPSHWHWPSSFEHSLGLPRLARARDVLLPRPAGTERVAPVTVGRRGAVPAPGAGRDITVVTHELTLTGAPKVALEVTAMLLVESMLSLHKQLTAANTGHEKTALQRQIDATDRHIDQLVYELYGLTERRSGSSRGMSPGIDGKVPTIHKYPPPIPSSIILKW